MTAFQTTPSLGYVDSGWGHEIDIGPQHHSAYNFITYISSILQVLSVLGRFGCLGSKDLILECEPDAWRRALK